MHCWVELKSLWAQRVVEVGAYILAMCAIFRMCGNESQPGLQLVEKLAMLLVVLVIMEL